MAPEWSVSGDHVTAGMTDKFGGRAEFRPRFGPDCHRACPETGHRWNPVECHLSASVLPALLRKSCAENRPDPDSGLAPARARGNRSMVAGRQYTTAPHGSPSQPRWRTSSIRFATSRSPRRYLAGPGREFPAAAGIRSRAMARLAERRTGTRCAAVRSERFRTGFDRAQARPPTPWRRFNRRPRCRNGGHPPGFRGGCRARRQEHRRDRPG